MLETLLKAKIKSALDKGLESDDACQSSLASATRIEHPHQQMSKSTSCHCNYFCAKSHTLINLKMNLHGRSSTVKEKVISCVDAPRLKDILAGKFTEFRGLMDLHEKQILEKSRQLNECIKHASDEALIEGDELKPFIAAGGVEV